MRQTTLETPVRVPSAPFWVGLAGVILFGILASAAVDPGFLTAGQEAHLARWAPLVLCLGLGVWAWAARRQKNLALERLEERMWAATAALRAENADLQKSLDEHRHAEQGRLAHEQWLRLILQHSSDGLNIVEKNLETHARRLVLCNDRYVEISGYSREELEACPDLNRLTVDISPPETLEYCRQCIIEGRPYHGHSYWRRPDGKENHYEWTAAPFRIGDKYFVVGIDRDITERKLAEERAKQHQEMLSHVARVSMAGEMAGSLAHELNQPLSAIVNYAHGCVRRIQSDPRQTPEIVAAIEQIIAQAERAGQIIRWLRNFVRRQKTRRTSLDLNQAVAEALALVEHEARKRDIRIRLCRAPDPLIVLGDQVQIEQVILNLVRNGFEAMNSAAPDRRVLTVELSRNRAGQAEISVSDTGRGLDPENRKRLFDPFFTTKPDGLGLGLSISRSIIEEHEGRIRADPGPEGGAVFVVELPVRQEYDATSVT